MDPQDRKRPPEIINELIHKSSSFSFFQAVRLLVHQCMGNTNGDISPKKILEDHIRIRPELSLNFPGTDITGVEINGEDPLQFLITATFLY